MNREKESINIERKYTREEQWHSDLIQDYIFQESYD